MHKTTLDTRLLALLLLLLTWGMAACGSTSAADYPMTTRTEQTVAVRTLPDAIPTTAQDFVLPFQGATTAAEGLPVEAFSPENTVSIPADRPWSITWDRLNLCTANYSQVQLQINAVNLVQEGHLQISYTHVDQMLDHESFFLHLPIDRDGIQTLAVNIADARYFDGRISTLRLHESTHSSISSQSLEILDFRLVRNDLPDQCAVENRITHTPGDFVFDFSHEKVSFLNMTYTLGDDGIVSLSPGVDPVIAQTNLELCARDYDYVAVTVRLAPGTGPQPLQIFYAASPWQFTPQRSRTISIPDDGEVREYVISVKSLHAWRGRIDSLRLDPVPAGNPGDEQTVQIHDFRLIRGPEPMRCPPETEE